MLLCMLLLVRVYVSVDVSAGGVYVIVHVVAGACACMSVLRVYACMCA